MNFTNFTTPFFFNHVNSNKDSALYPLLTTDAKNTIIINNQLTQTFNATARINLGTENCNNLVQLVYTSHSGANTRTYNKGIDYTCSNRIVNLTITGIEPGNNNVLTKKYNYDRTELSAYCEATMGMFDSMAELLSLIILVIMFTLVVGMLTSGNLNMKEFLITSVITIVFVAIVNIFGGIIVAFLC